jgi:hypothetical protein
VDGIRIHLLSFMAQYHEADVFFNASAYIIINIHQASGIVYTPTWQLTELTFHYFSNASVIVLLLLIKRSSLLSRSSLSTLMRPSPCLQPNCRTARSKTIPEAAICQEISLGRQKDRSGQCGCLLLLQSAELVHEEQRGAKKSAGGS